MSEARRIEAGANTRVKRTMAIIAAIALAPIVASYLAYYFWPRNAHVNYGELLPTKPVPPIAGVRVDGAPFRLEQLRGRWVILMSSTRACENACERTLFATRQARTIQGKEMERVQRVLLKTADVAFSQSLLAQHRGLEVVDISLSDAATLPLADGRIYLIDPLGNGVLAWPADPDIKALAKDVGRLLRASQIG